MRFCLIVRGPLGVGKTTVSEALAKVLHARVVSIDQILERHNLEEWEDGYISVGSFLRANDFALEEAAPHLRQDLPVIVDGNFYHRAVIDDLLARVHVPHAVVTLVAPKEVCLQRDRGRPVSFGPEGVEMVYAKVGSVQAGVEVDAARPLEIVVQEIAEAIPSILST